MKNEHLSNKKWVLHQFDKSRLMPAYRNVFIHTSFIEGLLIDESEKGIPLSDKEKKKGFCTITDAIKLLNIRDKNYTKLFKKRNDLIHGIIKKKSSLNQDDIHKIIKDMHCHIIDIYKEDYIGHLFNKRGYDFSPKDKIKTISEKELQQGLSDA